jgi:hypothetical protein
VRVRGPGDAAHNVEKRPLCGLDVPALSGVGSPLKACVDSMEREGGMRNVAASRAVLASAVAGLLLAALPTQADGPFQYHSLTPCRLADTRNAAGASGGPILTDGSTRNFPVQGLCAVPVGAKAVSLNVTAVGPNGIGFLTLFPAGITRPVVSTLNYAAGEPAIANGAIVPLADQSTQANDLAIFARVAVANGTVHMVLDVTGYFQ